jgi:N-acetylglucosaminyldiphosphoundecaprenol N-acetyl-beta-D-mannosaminyltransferase
MPIIPSWNYPVIKGDLNEFYYKEQKQFLINTISPNSYGLAVKNPAVKEALQKSNALILDGLYFGLISVFKNGIKINRIAGWGAFVFYSKLLNEENGKVFFLGSTQETLAKIAVRYKNEYPHVSIDFYSPPFKSEFSREDNLLMHNRINSFKPNVLFIGMTAPKQEVWAYKNKHLLDVNIICSIGNVFDWYARNSKRPGVFWQKIGLEWFARIFYRPEIFKRNIVNQLTFFWHLFLDVTRIKKRD